MRFLHGAELTSKIRATIAAPPVDMAVAFWGDKAIERLDLPADLADYRVACDARSGACSPTALGTLIKRGAKLVDVPGLHAKVYWSETGMVVGSANASTNGLTENELAIAGLEAGIWVSDNDALDKSRTWLNTTIASGATIKPEDLPEIKLLWDARRQSRPLRITLADALRRNSTALADRKERVYIYTTEQPPKDVVERYKRSPAFDPKGWAGRGFPFFWGDIPGVKPGEVLLCFEIEGRAFRWEGVWRVHDPLTDKGIRVWPATRLDQVLGMPLGDMLDVTRRARAALRAGRLPIDAPPISLLEFATALLPSFADDHIAKIRVEPVREAYRLLVGEAPRLGLTPSAKSGVLPAIRLHDERDRYAFSFNVNTRDLLFYLRDPALAASPDLAMRAERAGFAIEVPSERAPRDKPKTERQIRLSSPDDARRLIAWLATELPLPI
jgi:hypothetical protein